MKHTDKKKTKRSRMMNRYITMMAFALGPVKKSRWRRKRRGIQSEPRAWQMAQNIPKKCKPHKKAHNSRMKCLRNVKRRRKATA